MFILNSGGEKTLSMSVKHNLSIQKVSKSLLVFNSIIAI